MGCRIAKLLIVFVGYLVFVDIKSLDLHAMQRFVRIVRLIGPQGHSPLWNEHHPVDLLLFFGGNGLATQYRPIRTLRFRASGWNAGRSAAGGPARTVSSPVNDHIVTHRLANLSSGSRLLRWACGRLFWFFTRAPLQNRAVSWQFVSIGLFFLFLRLRSFCARRSFFFRRRRGRR